MISYENLYKLVKPDKVYAKLQDQLLAISIFRPPTQQEYDQAIQDKLNKLQAENKIPASEVLFFPGYTPWPTNQMGLPKYLDQTKQPNEYISPRDQYESADAICQRNQYLFDLKQQGWLLHPSDELKLQLISEQVYDDNVHPKLLIAIAEISDNRSEWRLYLGITQKQYKEWVKQYKLFRIAAEQAEQLTIKRMVNLALFKLNDPNTKIQDVMKWLNHYHRNDPELGNIITEEVQTIKGYVDRDPNIIAQQSLIPPNQRGNHVPTN